MGGSKVEWPAGWAVRAAFKMIKVAACRDSETPTKRRKFQLNVKAKQILTLLALCPKVYASISCLYSERSRCVKCVS